MKVKFYTFIAICTAFYSFQAYAQNNGLEEKNKQLIDEEAKILGALSTAKIADSSENKLPSNKKAVNLEVKQERPILKHDQQNSAESNAKLEQSQKRIERLVSELNETRNRLLLAETEVERLSAIVDERNRKEFRSAVNEYQNKPVAKSLATDKRPLPQTNNTFSKTSDTKDDMQIITVSSDKAFLRSGPGTNNSPLMSVSRGTRLVVETRNGDWYRVISPAGTRAWIASNVVVFGELSGQARNTRFGGYDSGAEDRAFNFINKRK